LEYDAKYFWKGVNRIHHFSPKLGSNTVGTCLRPITRQLINHNLATTISPPEASSDHLPHFVSVHGRPKSASTPLVPPKERAAWPVERLGKGDDRIVGDVLDIVDPPESTSRGVNSRLRKWGKKDPLVQLFGWPATPQANSILEREESRVETLCRGAMVLRAVR
jgi:hypothetical protein